MNIAFDVSTISSCQSLGGSRGTATKRNISWSSRTRRSTFSPGRFMDFESLRSFSSRHRRGAASPKSAFTPSRQAIERSRQRRRRSFQHELLEARQLLAADVIINELMYHPSEVALLVAARQYQCANPNQAQRAARVHRALQQGRCRDQSAKLEDQLRRRLHATQLQPRRGPVSGDRGRPANLSVAVPGRNQCCRRLVDRDRLAHVEQQRRASSACQCGRHDNQQRDLRQRRRLGATHARSLRCRSLWLGVGHAGRRYRQIAGVGESFTVEQAGSELDFEHNGRRHAGDSELGILSERRALDHRTVAVAEDPAPRAIRSRSQSECRTSWPRVWPVCS